MVWAEPPANLTLPALLVKVPPVLIQLLSMLNSKPFKSREFPKKLSKPISRF